MASKKLTIKQLMEEYPYSDRDIRRKLKEGKIKGIKPEGKWLIPEEEVHRLLGQPGVIKFPPLGELFDLLQRWREQIQFWSLDELLREVGLEASRKDRLPGMTEWVAKIYHAAKRHHTQTDVGPLRVSLSVEQEGIFHRLNRCLPDDPVWTVQDSWAETYATYLNAFTSWSGEVEHYFELYFALALREEPQERGHGVANGRELLEQLKKEDVNWRVLLKLTSLVLSCDLLTFGIQELPSNLLWFFEVDKLKVLREDAVNLGAALPRDLSLTQGDIGGVARLLWDHEADIRDGARDLLQNLQTLRAAQDDLHRELTALEHRLYDVAESQRP